MEDWHNFYMLAGGTAGTLIGLIFIVITLGMEHSKAGDEVPTRLFVTPILVHFACLLIISLVMVAPTSALTRALALGAIGCAGLAYVTNLALMSQRRTGTEDREFLWDVLLPIASLCAGGDRSRGVGASGPLRQYDRGRRGPAAPRHRAPQQLGGHARHRGTRQELSLAHAPTLSRKRPKRTNGVAAQSDHAVPRPGRQAGCATTGR
jgi:hypothetical protein